MKHSTHSCLSPEEVVEDPICEYYSKSTLKDRGWTAKMIQVYLGFPEFLLTNPRNYKHPIQCYSQERVLRAESLDDFVRDMEYKNRVKSKVLETRKKNNTPTAFDNFVKRFMKKVEEMDLSKKRYPKHIAAFLKTLGLSVTPKVYKQLISTLSDWKNKEIGHPIIMELYLKGLFVVCDNEDSNPKFYIISRNKIKQLSSKYKNHLST